MRLLEYLLENKLAPDERTARGWIMAGKVLVDNLAVTAPSMKLGSGQEVRLRSGVSTDVSRGAAKLRPALAEAARLDLEFTPAGKVCMDLGASTGGFSQVLLESGASRVYAVDVGYGLLAHSVRSDPRTVVLERTNARTMEPELVSEQIELLVGDLSFISWAAVLPGVRPMLANTARVLLLVKPQFELAAAGQGASLEHGVVSEPELVRNCLLGLYNLWGMHELGVMAVMKAGLRGASGNQEYFVALKAGQTGLDEAQYAASVDAAMESAAK